MEIDLNGQAWQEKHNYTPDMLNLAGEILKQIHAGLNVEEAIRNNPMPEGGYLGKSVLIAAYTEMTQRGELEADIDLLARIRKKPIRTLSGVATVTVLTKPYPCPGECIFCPTEVRMPKSYLIGEPGAMRGLQNNFDPYLQVSSRIEALEAVGHPTEKIELLVLGGTWSAYRRDYQEWFIHRCLDAMNGIITPNLESAQAFNERSKHRNVGLVIETRPDYISRREATWLRRLGVTKIQLGAQSLNDAILKINKRGHTADQTLQAVSLLRAFGFKVVVHWMPNLLGADLESDRLDFSRLWDGISPDEIKIYPNQLLENAELYEYWQRGEFIPYTTEELIDLIADIKPTIPRYCRVNRIIRDIPSTLVVEGNKRTSLRQDIHRELERRGEICNCIRCREVRKRKIDMDTLKFNSMEYFCGDTQEQFLSFDTLEDKLAGFLRLSLPGKDSPDTGIEELKNAAIIREVHVYGQSLPISSIRSGAAQHIGLGSRLIRLAEKIARRNSFKKLAVISAIGTRQYYLNRGFERGELYMIKKIG